MKKVRSFLLVFCLAASLFLSAKWAVGNLAPQFLGAKVEAFKKDTFGTDSLYYTVKDIITKEGSLHFLLQYLDAGANREVSLKLDFRSYNIVVLLKSLPSDFQIEEVYMQEQFIDIYTVQNKEKFWEFVTRLQDSDQFREVEGYEDLFLIKVVTKE